MNNKDEKRYCPRCGAVPGTLHDDGCRMEVCPDCGKLLFVACICGHRATGSRIPWLGEWPGKRECREFGWWAAWTPEQRAEWDAVCANYS